MATPVLTLSGYNLTTKSAPRITPRIGTLGGVDWAIGGTFLMQAFTSGLVKVLDHKR